MYLRHYWSFCLMLLTVIPNYLLFRKCYCYIVFLSFFTLVLLFSAILRNEIGWFDEEEHNSSLVAARLATDAADVKSAIAERISVILQNMTSLLTSFIVAFIVEWRVSLLILATFPLLVLANFAQVSTKDSQLIHTFSHKIATIVSQHD